MTNLSCKVISALKGKSLVTAESCTGGGIGEALTAVPGSSDVYKGGVICYSNWVKQNILGVDPQMLKDAGPVSSCVADAMACGAQKLLQADIAVSVTGLAGPGGDDYRNPVGTVFIGIASGSYCHVRQFLFKGERKEVRDQAVEKALEMILELF